MGLRTLRLAFRLGIWILCASLSAALSWAQGVDNSLRVVVNKDNKITSLTTDDLSRIFLGKKTLWESGTRIVPAMPAEESPAGELFLSGTLKKSVGQFRAYWKRLLFSGGGTVPKVFRSNGQLIEFVVRQPGAIAIVEAYEVDDRVRALDVLN